MCTHTLNWCECLLGQQDREIPPSAHWTPGSPADSNKPASDFTLHFYRMPWLMFSLGLLLKEKVGLVVLLLFNPGSPCLRLSDSNSAVMLSLHGLIFEVGERV